MGNWSDKATVKKGTLGESLVRRHLENSGYVVYEPATEGAHAFDKLCVSKDKKTLFIAEVKTKPHRLKYPDTGIDIRHYHEYQFIQEKYGLDVFIFFVDEYQRQVYGNILRILDRACEVEHNGRQFSYPFEQGGIRYFALASMKKISDLSEEQTAEIGALSTRKYLYPDSRV